MENKQTHPPIKGCLVPDEYMADWLNCHVCHDDLDAYMEEDNESI